MCVVWTNRMLSRTANVDVESVEESDDDSPAEDVANAVDNNNMKNT